MAAAFDPYYTWLAIRPEEQPADHYRLLGLRRLEDDADVIINAVDQRVNYLRTLQGGAHAELAQRLIAEVQVAGECLLDPRQKAHYDRELLARIERAAAALAPAAVAPAVSVRVSQTPQPLSAPVALRPRHGPASKADQNQQIAIALGGVAAVAIVGAALLFAARWARQPAAEISSRPDANEPEPRDPAAVIEPPQEPAVEPAAATAKSDVVPADSEPAEPSFDQPQTDASPPVEPTASIAPPASEATSAEKVTIDLLATPNDQLRMPWGKFTRRGNELILEGKANALEFPQPLPAEYALEVEVIRELGDNSLCFTLPVGDRVLTAIVDGFYSTVSGLAAIDDREIFAPNSPHAVRGKQLTNGQPGIVRIEVSGAAVRLLVDGQLVTRWVRDDSVPIRAAKGMGVSDPRKLNIFTWEARYRFQRIELLPPAASP